jgi:hypothetical protein
MKKHGLAFLILAFLTFACGWFAPPEPVQIPLTRLPPTAPPKTAISALTPDQVKNAKVQLVSQDKHQIVQLTNGAYQSAADVSSPDFMSINLTPQMAFGDLNGDGVGDAALLLAENYGGSGVFVSLVAMLDQNGQPLQAASVLIDDRPKINSLGIRNGQILLDAIVHGPNDPACCAARPTKQTFRYAFGKLMRTAFSSAAPDGTERLITITRPSDGDQFKSSAPLTVTGAVTIAPFENNLVYSVFDSNGDQVSTGSLLVQASQPGGPGSFSLPVDLSRISATGPVLIQFVDSSPADGSILSLGSVMINIVR